MEKKPFFSIVIPTYNRIEELEFALYCIFRQNFTNYEIVISDNCSTDETEKIISKLKSKKIQYFRNKQNIDYALNVKEAVSRAKGEYVFLHGDDDFLLYKNTLAIICQEIKKYKPGFVRINYISLALDKKHIFSYKVKKPFTQDEYFLPSSSNSKILKFITDSDPYFITGIVFKNTLPQSISMINSDPYPWIEVLFYVVKNFGALFIAKPNIIATWSRRTIKTSVDSHFFSETDEKLKSEN